MRTCTWPPVRSLQTEKIDRQLLVLCVSPRQYNDNVTELLSFISDVYDSYHSDR